MCRLLKKTGYLPECAIYKKDYVDSSKFCLYLNQTSQYCFPDLYGLLLFLGIDPYWVQMWWNRLVFDPYCHGVKEPMYDLLSSVLWRTVKVDVLDQVQ